jgi:hypothetical protein
VPELHSLLDEFSTKVGVVRFLTVYVEEAHAQDEWPIGHPDHIKQPRTTAERIAVARKFVENYSYRIPVVIDVPESGNLFEQLYAPWPIRFYVIKKRKMAFIAQPDNCTFSLARLRTAILHSLGP